MIDFNPAAGLIAIGLKLKFLVICFYLSDEVEV